MYQRILQYVVLQSTFILRPQGKFCSVFLNNKPYCVGGFRMLLHHPIFKRTVVRDPRLLIFLAEETTKAAEK
jgi:hypothetical protein